jgi:mannose-6-phosphate isomerase-like protein (cupin superfamily)
VKINCANASHYSWGESCDGWILSGDPTLSVIEERMPAAATEVRHYHLSARQFFYLLSGALEMEIEGETHRLNPGDGIEVAPKQRHCASNPGLQDNRFLVISSPTTRGDRVNEA